MQCFYYLPLLLSAISTVNAAAADILSEALKGIMEGEVDVCRCTFVGERWTHVGVRL